MSKFNINYLNKEELTYELLNRNLEITNPNVEALRKQLRSCINVTPEVKYLTGKISLKPEIKILQDKIDVLQVQIDNCKENPTPLLIAKINAKISHLQVRLDNLGKCELTPTYQESVKVIKLQVDTLATGYEEIKTGISADELSKFEEKLNNSLILEDEENLQTEQKLQEEAMHTSTPSKIPDPKTCMTLHANPETELQKTYIPTSTASHMPMQLPDTSKLTIFNKLQNPVEKCLEKFPICSGLEINPLLKFLGNLIKIQQETNLTPDEIYQILPGYATPPLTSIILDSKKAGRSLEELHTEILNTFIPITLREKLKQDLVYRPQKPEEPLSIYISEIKLHHEILKTPLTEKELVTFIKNGLNPEIRNKLIFENNPSSFQDLQQLCISVNNVRYNDYLRTTMFSTATAHGSNQTKTTEPNLTYARRNTQNHTPNRNQNYHEKRCYNCNKSGHIARYCYRPTKNW